MLTVVHVRSTLGEVVLSLADEWRNSLLSDGLINWQQNTARCAIVLYIFGSQQMEAFAVNSVRKKAKRLFGVKAKNRKGKEHLQAESGVAEGNAKSERQSSVKRHSRE